MTRREWAIIGAAVLGVGLLAGARLLPDDGGGGIDPSLRRQIDNYASVRDCEALQDIFNATRGDAARQLNYIDDALREADCYD